MYAGVFFFVKRIFVIEAGSFLDSVELLWIEIGKNGNNNAII